MRWCIFVFAPALALSTKIVPENGDYVRSCWQGFCRWVKASENKQLSGKVAPMMDEHLRRESDESTEYEESLSEPEPPAVIDPNCFEARCQRDPELRKVAFLRRPRH